jgi:uncharacterized protein (DUF362 family)
MDDNEKSCKVRAALCDYRASVDEIYRVLAAITESLDRSWRRIERAERVVVKFNMMKLPEKIAYLDGRRRELVDDAVCRAVLRLLRERTGAEIFATDTNTYTDEHLMGEDFNYAGILKEFDVGMVDSNKAPFRSYEVPGARGMFGRYTLSACLEGAEVVSVAKLKNHKFMGVTLCMKNLFGLPPISPPAGKARPYFHHIIRLPYVLADLAAIADPCLNIVDGLIGQKGREWGGEGRICDTLIAGDQTTATDACAVHLMGHDPGADWPVPPFRRDRNHLLVAAQRGYGSVDLRRIDFASEVEPPLADFDSEQTDPSELIDSWRRTTCEQALLYREQKERFIESFRNEFIYLQRGRVVWHGPDPTGLASRRVLSGRDKGQGMWLKLVDPDETEQENFSVYEGTLEALAGSQPISQSR